MTTYQLPITSSSESTPKTRVVYDMNGKIISLTSPNDLATAFIETIATDRLFIANLQNEESPNRNIRYTVDQLLFSPTPNFWQGLDHRADTIIQMQNPWLGTGGLPANLFVGVTTGVAGGGVYAFNEVVEQSIIRPSVTNGAANAKPIYDTTLKKFGVSSAKFYGNVGIPGASGSCISLAGLTVPNATQNILSMDLFFNVSSGNLNPALNHALLAKRPDPVGGSTLDNEFLLYFDGGADKLRFSFLRTGQTGSFSNTIDIATISAITLDTWHHVAITNRGGSYMNGYFNGTLAATAGAVTLYPGGSRYAIGADLQGSNPFTGNIDNLRIIIAASGGTSGYDGYYSGSTYPVPTGTSELLDGGEIKYLFPFDGVQGSSLFVVRTPDRSTGRVSRFDSSGRLYIRKTASFNNNAGFTAGGYGYPHGLSSGAVHAQSIVTNNLLSLADAKQIEQDRADYTFISLLQTPIEGSGGYSGSSNPFVRLFGFTGNSGGNVNFYGPTGATQDYFSIIPQKEVITQLSNWVNAYTIGAALGLTHTRADVGGTIHHFTRNDTKNLFMDLYGWYDYWERSLVTTKTLIAGATGLSNVYGAGKTFGTRDTPPSPWIP